MTEEHPVDCCPCHDEDCQEVDRLQAQVEELEESLRQMTLRAEDAERELSEWKSQWFGDFPPLAREDLKVRCLRCWDEAKSREAANPDTPMSVQDWYVHLVRQEWCVRNWTRGWAR